MIGDIIYIYKIYYDSNCGKVFYLKGYFFKSFDGFELYFWYIVFSINIRVIFCFLCMCIILWIVLNYCFVDSCMDLKLDCIMWVCIGRCLED